MEVYLSLLAFITGNSSLEPLLEGLFAQIHIELTGFSARCPFLTENLHKHTHTYRVFTSRSAKQCNTRFSFSS